jgi:hypothetical protein
MDLDSSKKLLTFEGTANLLSILEHAPFIGGCHLVDSPWQDGLVPALQIHGAQRKNIVLVQRTSEEAFEASERLDCRVVHASASDIAKERRHKLATAFISLRGPLTEDGVAMVRDVLVHGMAEGSALTVTFDIGGETGEYKTLLDALREEAAPPAFNASGEPVTKGIYAALVLRGRLLRRQLVALLQGAKAWWFPTDMFYVTHEEDALLATCSIQGVVRRTARSLRCEVPLLSARIASCDTTQEEFRRRVLSLYASFERGLPDCDRRRESFLQQHLHQLFNIEKETLDQWRMQVAVATTTTDS